LPDPPKYIQFWTDILGNTRRTGARPRRSRPGTAVDRQPGGGRGQDTGGQDHCRTETGPGPSGARQDQPAGAGPGQEAAADHRRRVRARQHCAGRGRQAAEPDRRRRVRQGQRVRRRRRQTGTVSACPLADDTYKLINPY